MIDFKKQVLNIRIGKDLSARVYLKWENTEDGRDRYECYERIAKPFIIYTNVHNQSMLTCKGSPFFETLEEMYQSALKKNNKTESIFLIEKGWIDPMENKNADGYKPYKYAKTEDEAKQFCDSHGHWKESDCWSIRYSYPDGIMQKYRFVEIQNLKK